MIIQQRYSVLISLALLLALTATTLVTYWPGTSGGFLLDDAVNLSDLGRYGGVHDLERLRAFVMSGVSGPAGNPLGLLSFVIDGQNWPTDPFPFLRTNILIHAVNGVLIFFCVVALMRINGRDKEQMRWLAFVCAALWLLHPLQLSTVLYITQRMEELSTLFILCGVLLYLYGRHRLDDNPGAGYLCMSVAVVGGTVLATLSSKTGVLMPLYLAVIEFTLLCQRPRPQHWRYWSAVMFGLPILALLVYLFSLTFHGEDLYQDRDFTLYERLINQPLILFKYLFQIILPVQLPSLMHDEFRASRSLLEAATFSAFLSLIAVITVAIHLRRRQPVLSFAILWFFCGHLWEGSTVSTDLYSEYRNYMPLLGPLLALAYYGQRLISAQRFRVSMMVLPAVVLASITWNFSHVWGDKERLLATWAQQQPDSLWARISYIDEILKSRSSTEAVTLLEQLRADFPQRVSIEIEYATALCLQGRLTESAFGQLLEMARTQPRDVYTENSLRLMLESHLRGQCQIPPQALLALIETVEKNDLTPLGQPARVELLLMKSHLYQHYNQTRSVLNVLDEIFGLNASVDIALMQATLLLNIKQLQAANVQLNKAEAMDRLRHRWTPSNREAIERVRALLREQG